MIQFCEENGVPYDRCGKLIVATNENELPRLRSLYERGAANGIQGLEIIGPERTREIEPHAKAVQALFSPNTAITEPAHSLNLAQLDAASMVHHPNSLPYPLTIRNAPTAIQMWNTKIISC